ncbi:uncharacterized protein F5147DRAFT_800076 [Suillus discolor]|uniref:Uncharacterized protein n=1 Tax=Suillus discolor TaxID=1912936 RepID=A0A9P7F6I9_9AGAM|nr:uncharacterized protein F5147DRAFT_800076 [Suillus discolor]KAG2108178.1 hypothetical protein F5147DRAFT_800076 [Suillus discolor]
MDLHGSPIFWIRRPFTWINSCIFIQQLNNLHEYTPEGEPVLDIFAEVQYSFTQFTKIDEGLWAWHFNMLDSTGHSAALKERFSLIQVLNMPCPEMPILAFDVASMYMDQDPQIIHFLLLIKTIALFNADQDDKANLLLKELAAGCPDADALTCDVVQLFGWDLKSLWVTAHQKHCHALLRAGKLQDAAKSY